MKLRLVGMVAFTFVRLALAFGQTDAILPHVAEGVFSGGSFRMTFVLVNTNDVAAVVTITITDNNGAPLQLTIPEIGTQSQFEVTLEAGGTRLLQTAGNGSLRTGGARVTSNQTIGVSAIFSVYDPAGRFLTEAGVGDSSPGIEFVIPVDTTGNFNTGAAFFNPGPTTANLTIRLIDGGGQETMRANDVLEAGHQKARFIAGEGQIFPSATNFRGTAVVTSSSPIAAVVLRQNLQPLSYTSLPAVPRSGGKTQISLSQVANGTFDQGSFGTTFAVFNTSPTAANVTLTLANENGIPLTVTIVGRGTGSVFNLVLQAGGSVFLETDGQGPLTAGSAVITSNVPVGASAIFTVFDLQKRFLTEAGVGDASALTELTLPVDINEASDTGIAFYNPNTTSITLTIRLVDEEGATIASTELTISAHGHVARFATQFFPGQTSLRGSIAVTSSGGGVAAITLREDKLPLTYTTLPVVAGISKNANKPPSPLPLLDKTRTGLSITGNMTLDETLAEGKRLSGTINVSGLIYARASDGSLYSTFSLLPGPYLIVVPPGNYDLFVCQFSGGIDSILSLYHAEASPVQVTSDTTRNLNVSAPATFVVSGIVSGITGELANSSLNLIFYNSDTTSMGTFSLLNGGAYQAQVPSGTWNVSLMANAQLPGGRSQNLGLYNLGSVTVGGPTNVNFAVPPTARLSGTVRIPGLAALPPTTLAPTDISGIPTVRSTGLSCGAPAFGSSIQTESSGAYQIPLISGRTYDIAAYAQIVANNPELGNVGFPVHLIRRDVAGDTTQDVNFPALPPLVTITGRVMGPNGQPAARAQVNFNSTDITGAPDASYSAVTAADNAGNYHVTVLSGINYTVQFSPQPPVP